METRFLARDGGRIAYDDTGGDGPLVVCAPGMGDVRAVYRFLRPRLVEAGYRVVTMDLRGHGESSAGWTDHSPEAVGEDMCALVRRLDGGPAVLIGHSFSPSAAVWAAAEAPDLVAGVVLIAPWVSEVRLSPLLRALSQLIVRSAVLWTDGFYRSLYRAGQPDDFRAYRRSLRRNLRQPGRMAALRAMASASKARANGRLAGLACPVLVVMGARDPDFPDPAAEARLAAQRAGRATEASVAIIDGAGHYPMAELPGETAAAIVPFLDRARDGRRAA